MQKISEPEHESSRKMFKPKYNEEGKTKVIMRFLPPAEGESLPFVKTRKHYIGTGIKGTPFMSGDCIKDSSPDHKCPLCEKYWALKNSGADMAKSRGIIASAKTKYVTNVYIVENPNAPDTEGKVFTYEFSEQTMEVIREISKPHEDDETGEELPAIDVFSPTNGVNFIYKYDKSKKGVPAPNKFTKKAGPISDKHGVPLTDEQLVAVAKEIKQLVPFTKITATYESLCEEYTKRIHLPIGNSKVEADKQQENVEESDSNKEEVTNSAIQDMFA